MCWSWDGCVGEEVGVKGNISGRKGSDEALSE